MASGGGGGAPRLTVFASHILVLIPHPDDEVVGCAAAIARALRHDSEVYGAYLTSGVPAREVLWFWERRTHRQRVACRREEAMRAARHLGLQPVWFQEVATRRLKENLPGTREHIRQLIERLGIRTLWTPAYEGGHQDHDVTNFLASTFRDALPVWEFAEYNYAGGKIHSQEFLEATGAEQQVELEEEERRRKREALAIYASERGNLRHIRDEREAFRPLAAYDYTRPPHPGKLFYQRFQWVPSHPRVDYVMPEEVSRAIAEFREKVRTA